MTKYEYNVIELEGELNSTEVEQKLNEQGEAGWRLVAIQEDYTKPIYHRYFFTREA